MGTPKPRSPKKQHFTTGLSWPERHWQTCWTLSNFCDNNNIQSAIWMKPSFLTNDTSFNFSLQFYNKFELLYSHITCRISQGHSLHQVLTLWDHSFLSYAVNKQTDKQTERLERPTHADRHSWRGQLLGRRTSKETHKNRKKVCLSNVYHV